MAYDPNTLSLKDQSLTRFVYKFCTTHDRNATISNLNEYRFLPDRKYYIVAPCVVSSFVRLSGFYSTSYIVSNRKRRLYSTHYTGWNILPDSHRVCRFTFMWWQIDRGKRIKRRRVVVGALFFFFCVRDETLIVHFGTTPARYDSNEFPIIQYFYLEIYI